MCLRRDSLWSQLYDVIDNTLASEDARTVSLLAKTNILGEEANTTLAKKLRNVRKKLQWEKDGHDKFIGHLMLTTMQKQKHFELRDQVTSSPHRTPMSPSSLIRRSYTHINPLYL